MLRNRVFGFGAISTLTVSAFGMSSAGTEVYIAAQDRFPDTLTEIEPQIDFSVLAGTDSPPAFLDASTPNAVLVARQGPQGDGWTGSGFAIDPTHVITAGHVLPDYRQGDGLSENGCGEAVVHSTSDSSGFIGPTASGQPPQGRATGIGRYVSTLKDGYADYALAELTEPLPYDLSPVIVRSEPLAVGEPVYFINYQPDASLNQRNPNHNSQTSNILSAEAIAQGYDRPAVLGGIVVQAAGDLTKVLTGFRSYGTQPDDVIRGGASGGIVLDGHGSVAGMSVRRGDESEQLIDEMADKFNFDHSNAEAVDPGYTWAEVQPIRPDHLVRQLAELAAAPYCIPASGELTLD